LVPKSELDPIMKANALVKAAREAGVEGIIDCGVGVCSNEFGQPVVPKAICDVIETLSVEQIRGTYIPGTGYEPFLDSARTLLFGKQKNNVNSVQANGGTHALRIIADTLKAMPKFDPKYSELKIAMPNPTWGNHKLIFQDFEQQSYPYLDSRGFRVDIVALTRAIQNLEAGTAIILHPSCPNPASYPLSEVQWDMVLTQISERQKSGDIVLPIFDSAYQGFGRGLEEDAYPIRKAAELGLEFFVAESYSKKFALYRHRVGAVHFCSTESESRTNLMSQIGTTVIRPTVSSLSIAGADIAHRAMTDHDTMFQIENYLETKRNDFKIRREYLAEALDMPGLINGEGMFALIPGIGQEGQEWLWTECNIMTIYNPWIDPSGANNDAIRVCLDALNHENIGNFTNALQQVRALN